MIRHRLAAALRDERGFSLMELLVAAIMIGILAAIALALFLNQRNKAHDGSAKSAVTNLAHVVEACRASDNAADDYRNCDSETELDEKGLPLSDLPPAEIDSGDCGGPSPSDAETPEAEVRVLKAGKDCYTVIGVSKSGNVFWMIRHNDDSTSRDCTTRSVTGCPPDGLWAD
jgi:prepilin-type N-terminal cleavage/methylation domain-containing protein